MTRQFPQGFAWGTATASFQIEGATREDGKGESIWDRFAATPGKIVTGETGDPACDSYHRYQEDIALMREMGLNAYRFSIAWPRVIPDGSGAVNEAGLDYYERVVDSLLEAQITPYPTLYHWDLPQALQDRGGWANRAAIDAFVRYADIVVSRLGDRIKCWTTFNEPWCTSILSNLIGEHAPGLHDLKIALQVAHNVLVAHGSAVPVIRSRQPDAQVGIVLNFEPAYPATDSEADKLATQLSHEKFNRWFLDPIMGRGYPQNAWQHYGADVPEILPGDMETIASPIDFLGVNNYTRKVHRDPAARPGAHVLNQRDENNVSARGWEIFPRGLYDLLTWLNKDYDIPRFIITENGMARHDTLDTDGQIHDPERIAYIKQHLEMLLRAIEEGVPVDGYMVWSLMDNFEWAFGTSSRFGLAYVDFETQQRILKDSGKWYGRVARANAIVD
ncbi:MAG: beta-glucosidase [Anaerolineae bacterium]|nr:beta-glucosidase [Anaerolineae bacterium]